MFKNLQMQNKELQAETKADSEQMPIVASPAQMPQNPMLAAVDVKISELLKISDEFIFPAFYSHTGKIMWKIENVYTKYGGETIVLCPVDEGIEKALTQAIEYLSKKREEYYSVKQ